MSGASSNTSGASTGGNAYRRRGGVVMGIPKKCWCGDETVPLMSKSEKNPYRRYYRCATPARKKWIDEALVNEVETLELKTARLEQELREIQTKVEELCDKVEALLAEGKSNMKRMMIVGIVGCVGVLGIMELCIRKW
ncbi:uncharacterized protein At4g04775-like [Brassica rapa]|uniref:uncharacterized protein At4g04775-like n=1 Tax=Brassica campestris TaxID=3711 RepID=UPI0004F1C54D|nr:uncharacterized protein At4g04775-like [Brassica rapa]